MSSSCTLTQTINKSWCSTNRMLTSRNKYKDSDPGAFSWKPLKNNKEVVIRERFQEKFFTKQWGETFHSKTKMKEPPIILRDCKNCRSDLHVLTAVFIVVEKPWNVSQKIISLSFLKLKCVFYVPLASLNGTSNTKTVFEQVSQTILCLVPLVGQTNSPAHKLTSFVWTNIVVGLVKQKYFVLF